MEDTIRTRALQVARTNWRTVIHVTSWCLAAIVTVSVATGRKESDATYSKEAIARIESKLDSVVINVDSIKMQQAEAKQSQKDLGDRIDRMEGNWDNAFEHAGDWPRPRKRK